jgi:diguanylate cyclase (GGDEF)-like protein
MDNSQEICEFKETDLCNRYCEEQSLLCTEVARPNHLFSGYQQLSEERSKLNERLRFDELTGLHNKSTFLEIAQSYLDDAELNNKAVGLIVLDINNFKKFNETKGHIEGDVLLSSLGLNLRDQLRFEDLLIARFGGDEFLFLCDLEPRNSDTLLTAAERLSVIRDRVSKSVNECLKKHARYLSGAFGGSLWDGSQSLRELIVVADRHMYADKNNNKLPFTD